MEILSTFSFCFYSFIKNTKKKFTSSQLHWQKRNKQVKNNKYLPLLSLTLISESSLNGTIHTKYKPCHGVRAPMQYLLCGWFFFHLHINYIQQHHFLRTFLPEWNSFRVFSIFFSFFFVGDKYLRTTQSLQ